MKKILILFAHPRLEQSKVNHALKVCSEGLDFVTFIDLYAHYPDYQIDIAKEQQRLQAHDILIFQHPIYWYSCPALLKEWMDLVLEFGFAYGSGGEALKGKQFLSVVSSGGSETAYSLEGRHGVDLPALLKPFEQTANLCKMEFLPPFVFYSAGEANKDSLSKHTQNYKRLLSSLAEGSLELKQAQSVHTLEKIYQVSPL